MYFRFCENSSKNITQNAQNLLRFMCNRYKSSQKKYLRENYANFAKKNMVISCKPYHTDWDFTDDLNSMKNNYLNVYLPLGRYTK